MRVQVDTRNGENALCARLGVTRNRAYFLFLDSQGREISRISGASVAGVVRAMEAALRSPRGKDQIERLAQLLRDSDPGVRSDAVEIIGRLGPKAAKLVPSLVRLLNDSAGRPTVAWHAIGAMRALGPVAREAIPALSRLAADKLRAGNERQLALMALARLDPKGKSILPTLGVALEEDPTLVIGAAIAAKELREAAVELVPGLMRAFEDTASRPARCYLADALGAIGVRAKAALPLLRKAAAAKSPTPRKGSDPATLAYNASIGSFNVAARSAAAIRSIER